MKTELNLSNFKEVKSNEKGITITSDNKKYTCLGK